MRRSPRGLLHCWPGHWRATRRSVLGVGRSCGWRWLPARDPPSGRAGLGWNGRPLGQAALRLEMEQVLDLSIRQEAGGPRGEKEGARARPLFRVRLRRVRVPAGCMEARMFHERCRRRRERPCGANDCQDVRVESREACQARASLYAVLVRRRQAHP
jgi:hypothetical protein